MSAPQIHGKRPAYSASAAVEALAKAIGEIKQQDRLTWSDVGAVLGVSEDQAAKYADGSATMNAVTYGRGKKEWNGRFTGYFDRLCVESRPGKVDDHGTLTTMLDLCAKLSAALADGKIEPHEVQQYRTEIENARDDLNAQLDKLKPSEVA